MVNQITNSVGAADDGDLVILQVARAPTATELATLQNTLGNNIYNRIQVVSTQTNLYNTLNANLR